MGAWGPGLYQNDVALDVKDTYEDLLQKGVLDEEITDRILEEYADSLIDADDEPVIWFALADIQQRRGRLDETVKEKAISFIDAGADLPAWKNAPESLQRKRTEALNKLKSRLQSPQKPEKKIHHPRLYTCQWRIGDVYAYPLTSATAQEAGFYGDMLLFHKCDNTTEWPGNILPVVRMKLYRNHAVPPTLSDFMKLPYLRISQRGSAEQPEYIYQIMLENTSSRVIPKCLIYIGNTQEFVDPSDEWVFPQKNLLWGALWKWFDDCIIPRICSLNRIES